MIDNGNPLRNTRIEYHILQSFPTTCLNRDDVGAPKTAVVGGVTRARVSSQCWKRQVRMAMPDFGIKLAVRTKMVNKLITEACLDLGASDESAAGCGEKIAAYLTDDTLHFMTRTEAVGFAEYARDQEFDLSKLTDKAIQKDIARISKATLDPAVEGLDIALFGRMVAKAPEMNIEAAASFAHAISTHRVSNEIEFFTALDDRPEAPGSAHMGSLEYNSATYYRYISLDLGQLYQTLSGQQLDNAVEAFTKALFVAVPTARQATQSGASPWEYAKVLVRRGQRLQIPFETPIKYASGGGYLQPSIDFVRDYLAKKEKLYGSLFGKLDEYEFGLDENFSIDDLSQALKGHAGV